MVKKESKKQVLKKTNLTFSIVNNSSKDKNLEAITKAAKVPQNKEEVIEELVSELNIPETYKRIEKKMKKQRLDEEDALDLGIKSNNYYSAKEREDEEDELGGTFEESSGSFGHRSNTTH